MAHSRFELSVALSQIAANIGVIVALGLAAYTFYVQRKDAADVQRREAAREFVMLKHQDGYRDAIYAISEALEIKGPNLIFRENSLRAKRERMNEITRKIGLARIQQVADLYLAVTACVDADICDRTVIRKIYGSEIRQFYCWNGKFGLEELEDRLNMENYATPLIRYVDKPCRILL